MTPDSTMFPVARGLPLLLVQSGVIQRTLPVHLGGYKMEDALFRIEQSRKKIEHGQILWQGSQDEDAGLPDGSRAAAHDPTGSFTARNWPLSKVTTVMLPHAFAHTVSIAHQLIARLLRKY